MTTEQENEPYIIKAGDFDPKSMQLHHADPYGFKNVWVNDPTAVYGDAEILVIVRDKPKPPETLYWPFDDSDIACYESITDLRFQPLRHWTADPYDQPSVGWLTKSNNNYGVATNDEIERLRAEL